MAYREEKNLLKHKTFTVGTVKDIATYYQNGGQVFIKYEFKVVERIYDGQTSIVSKNKYNDRNFLKTVLIKRTFPVVFDSSDPDNSKILLAKDDYRKFNIKRPDSLSKYFIIIDSIAHPSD
jgi:hypothetical protein